MPIPFRDADEVDELGAAGFLKIETGDAPSEFIAALFLISARGEPLEFAYNRLEIPNTFLWRQADLRRHVERKLTVSLLQICRRVPRLLLGLAHEIGSELFAQDIQVSIPVGRIGEALRATPHSSLETPETLKDPPDVHVFWFPQGPESDTLERQLFDRLSSRGLLLEPFERASLGLREVYANGPTSTAP